MELVLTTKAYRLIVRQCASSPSAETGGILVGKKIGQYMVVPFVIGPGPKAKKSPTSFSPDLEWQRQYFEAIFWPHGFDVVGSFHSHPSHYPKPSPHDSQMAWSTLSSPHFNLSEIIFLIITINKNGTKIHPYYFARRIKKYRLIPWRKVTDLSPFAEKEAGS